MGTILNLAKKLNRETEIINKINKLALIYMKKLRMICKKSGLNNKKILEESGVVNVKKKKRFRILRMLAKDMKERKLCKAWPKKYMKIDFSTRILLNGTCHQQEALS